MANGWTPERRAAASGADPHWKPWARSTGPKTEEGKSNQFGQRHKTGLRGRDWLELATGD